jgi:hypothetical protein
MVTILLHSSLIKEYNKLVMRECNLPKTTFKVIKGGKYQKVPHRTISNYY